MQRVFFINRFFYPDHSATSQILSDLCFQLARDGLRVIVITSRSRYDASFSDKRLPRSESIDGVKIFRRAGTGFSRQGFFFRFIDYVSFYFSASYCVFRSVQPGDILVAMTDPPLLGVFLQPAVKLRRGKLVNWLQDLFPEVAESLSVRMVRGSLASFTRYLRNANCRSALMNVVVGNRMFAYLAESGVDMKRLVVIPNWAPTDLRPVGTEKNELRKEWFCGGYFVVGYSGNLGRAHDWQTIFQCMDVLRSNNRIRFLMIGGGAGMEKLREAVAEGGLTNVQFEPYQPLERLAESLSASDIHMVSLQPRVSDYLVPSKVYGIAAVARPMLYIGEEESEIGDMLHCYNNGVIVRPGDSSALAGAILYLSENPEEIQLMGERGRRMYEDNYSAPKAHAAWQQLLAKMM